MRPPYIFVFYARVLPWRCSSHGTQPPTPTRACRLVGNPNTTCGAPAPPAPAPVPNLCTYRGTYTITPRYSPCAKTRITYSTECSDVAVTLRSGASLTATTSASWGLNHDVPARPFVPTSNPIAASTRSCNATALGAAALPGAATIGLVPSYSWLVVPVKGDCNQVNLISASLPNVGFFLTVPRTCQTFTWSTKDGGRARFTLTKVSELGR